MSDKELYQLIADELKTKNMDPALWIQAKESGGGDPDKTEAAYIRLRFLELVKSSRMPVKPASPVGNTNTAEARPKVDELSRMRSELAKKLLNQGKYSLYSIVNLQPDASDAVVAAAIADLESRNLGGSGGNPAEFKYAKDTLSDPKLREQYDRQLLASVSNSISNSSRFYTASEMSYDNSWWESGKTSVIVGVLSIVLLGYLGLSYMKERNHSDIQKVTVESQKEVMHAISEKAQADTDLRAEALRLAAERQNHEMELRNRAADRIYEQQRNAEEYRALAEQQRADAERKRKQAQEEQAENLRVMREKQYWACMNQQLNVQLSRRNGSSSDAEARCAMYR